MSLKLPKSDVLSLSDWICEQGLLRVRLEDLLSGFCERLEARGLPLMRGYLSAQTLHPRIAVLGCSWRPDEGIRTDVILYRPEPSEAYLNSPFKRLIADDLNDLRVRLEGTAPLPFPVCEEFREEGGSDYFAQLVRYGRNGEPDGRTGVIFSWTSAEPGGFSDEDIALFRFLAPRLGMAVQTRISQDININLLDAYVGSTQGRRILNGEIRRGALDVISAVILLADLRGFTAMSERTDRDELVEMLNQYFDCLVGPIHEHGGNVLKFLGDGLLATFPLNGKAADQLCEHALEAAMAALKQADELNVDRIAAGKPAMDLDIALHLGDVYWGNVGSAERLDFTIVGPAVNEAARIETLCTQYERSLLMSETFAKAATRSSQHLVPIGRFALRGVRSVQSIYTHDGMLAPDPSDRQD